MSASLCSMDCRVTEVLTPSRMKTLYCCVGQLPVVDLQCSHTDFLISNGEFALRLLVVLCKGLQLHYRLCLQDRSKKFDILFGVLVARLCSVSIYSLKRELP